MEIEQETIEQLRKDTESVKLYKNSRGYNWEIKLLEVNIDRLETINDEMKARFEENE